ncbi:pyruvate dehydrogenase E2 component (dihydrolipoamide acetyltransferase) [Streptomyces sp. WMMB 714]|uniref:dihydrolipoamide acetyltransferase family protein n=1 Tax=Streptomyces sp. WMMB 714 TaxID=1286822 RepID=UPI0005F88027|nr:pyruvate dehydrogenase E2 component (dihydrolipoamide acetyltransferase) [Streptomyces sp. WMMB 714]
MSAVRREFRLPDLGEGLTEAEIVRWLVAVGDRVDVDQPLVEVETAKAQVEIPSPYAGEVLERRGAPGSTHAVGAVLVVIAEPAGRDPGGGMPAGEPVLVGYGTRDAAPAVRRPASVPAAASAGGRAAAPAPPRQGTLDGPVPVVSPLVRRMAREHGVDLRTVRGTGPAGLVGRSDVTRAISAPVHPRGATPPARNGTPAATGSGPPGTGPGDGVTVWHGARRAAARRVTDAHREIPAATCWRDADATGLLDLSRASREGPGPRAGVLALLARMCVVALQRHPELCSRVVHGADGTATGVRAPASLGLGIATHTERGVVVPVVHDAGRLTTAQLTAEIGRLVGAARDGTLTPHESTGGCFTLNNHGPLGTDGAVPLINHPETAMLGVGRIARRPWVSGDAVVPRSVAPLSLTFDHRVCDGGTAAAFLACVAEAVTRPGTLLLHL